MYTFKKGADQECIYSDPYANKLVFPAKYIYAQSKHKLLPGRFKPQVQRKILNHRMGPFSQFASNRYVGMFLQI